MDATQQRSCGTCTACCLTHAIRELDKPPGVWCTHCNIDKGCAIYGDHPPGCKEFACQWLLGTLPIEERPDQTGVVVDFFDLPEFGITMMIYEAKRGALESPYTKHYTSVGLAHAYPVCHLPLSGRNKMHLPAHLAVTPEMKIEFEATFRIDEKYMDIVPFPEIS